MLVTIVYVPTPDMLGPDTSRMGKVEDIDAELARMMLGDGSARLPNDDELAAYEDPATAADEASGEPADEPAAEQSRPSAVIGGGPIKGIRQKEPK